MRGRLTAAARDLFAAQGVDATSIAEIAARAGVGSGSFYNHFTDKDAIIGAVLAAAGDALGAELDRLSAGLDDPAEIMSVAHRHLVRLTGEDPTWGWLMVRLDASYSVMTAAIGARAERDMQRGIDAGRFVVEDATVALFVAGGALLGAIRARLAGVGGDRTDELHAELVLRALGLPPAEAAQVARRPMPGR